MRESEREEKILRSYLTMPRVIIFLWITSNDSTVEQRGRGGICWSLVSNRVTVRHAVIAQPSMASCPREEERHSSLFLFFLVFFLFMLVVYFCIFNAYLHTTTTITSILKSLKHAIRKQQHMSSHPTSLFVSYPCALLSCFSFSFLLLRLSFFPALEPLLFICAGVNRSTDQKKKRGG